MTRVNFPTLAHLQNSVSWSEIWLEYNQQPRTSTLHHKCWQTTWWFAQSNRYPYQYHRTQQGSCILSWNMLEFSNGKWSGQYKHWHRWCRCNIHEEFLNRTIIRQQCSSIISWWNDHHIICSGFCGVLAELNSFASAGRPSTRNNRDMLQADLIQCDASGLDELFLFFIALRRNFIRFSLALWLWYYSQEAIYQVDSLAHRPRHHWGSSCACDNFQIWLINYSDLWVCNKCCTFDMALESIKVFNLY